MQLLSVAKHQSSDNANSEEEQDLSIVVTGCRVIGEYEGDKELKEITERKSNPIIAVYAFSYLLAEDQQGHVGEDDHQPSQTDRVYGVKYYVKSFTVCQHNHDKSSNIHDGSSTIQNFETDSR